MNQPVQNYTNTQNCLPATADDSKDDFVFFTGLNRKTKASKVLSIFGRYGRIVGLDVPTDKCLKENKGYGYVLFQDIFSSWLKLKTYPHVYIDGNTVTIRRVAPREDSDLLKFYPMQAESNPIQNHTNCVNREPRLLGLHTSQHNYGQANSSNQDIHTSHPNYYTEMRNHSVHMIKRGCSNLEIPDNKDLLRKNLKNHLSSMSINQQINSTETLFGNDYETSSKEDSMRSFVLETIPEEDDQGLRGEGSICFESGSPHRIKPTSTKYSRWFPQISDENIRQNQVQSPEDSHESESEDEWSREENIIDDEDLYSEIYSLTNDIQDNRPHIGHTFIPRLIRVQFRMTVNLYNLSSYGI